MAALTLILPLAGPCLGDEPPPPSAAPSQGSPAQQDAPTVEQCDDAFATCLEDCEKSMPGVSGEMLCTGCGWDCNVVHKKCLAKTYYRRMFGE